MLKVSEGKKNNEFIVTRHSQFKVPINIINIYGDIESRTPVDVIDNKWEEILKEISKIEAREELLILIGDLNKHVPMTNSKSDTKKKASHGGKLIEELLENEDYILVNNTDKTKGGPNTRYSPEDPNDESKKSALDLVIVSKSLFQYILKLEVDRELKWTPCRPIGKNHLRYTDHYALLLIFSNLPMKKKKH